MADVKIPERLLLELYQLHVLCRPQMADMDYIKSEIEKKMAAWKRRVDYSADLERKRKEKHGAAIEREREGRT